MKHLLPVLEIAVRRIFTLVTLLLDTCGNIRFTSSSLCSPLMGWFLLLLSFDYVLAYFE